MSYISRESKVYHYIDQTPKFTFSGINIYTIIIHIRKIIDMLNARISAECV